MNDHERKLLKSARNGGVAAFEELTAPHHKIIYNYILSKCGNEFEACQLTQDVFVKVFEQLTAGSLQGDFFACIYRTAGDVCRNIVRVSQKIS